MTHRVCRDIFVSQTNLFNSRYTFSKKDDFLTKSTSPMVCSAAGASTKYLVTDSQRLAILAIISPWSRPLVCYPLLVDEPVESFYSSFLKQEF